jgi:GNAT superfamily N-acetyltransferase
MGRIEVRGMVPGDEAGAAEVAREAGATLRKVYLSSKRPASGMKLTRLVAVLDGRVAGIAAYEARPDGLFFCNLGVLESFRRRGLTRAMVAALEGIAAGLGLRKLSCSTIEETGNALVFGRLGFKVTARELSDIASAGGGELHEVFLDKYLGEGK